MIIVLSVILFVILLVFLFLGMAHEKFERNVTISTDGITSKTLHFSKLNLYPGESVEYTINVSSVLDGEYDVSLNFNQTENGHIAQFVVVEISCGDEVRTERLGVLFNDSESISFKKVPISKEPQRIKVKYTMPYEVGNEAKNTWSKFDIVLEATPD